MGPPTHTRKVNPAVSRFSEKRKTCFFFFLVFFFAYGGSQARGLIGAVAASLRQSHSNTGSELCLQPIPQLMATPDP